MKHISSRDNPTLRRLRHLAESARERRKTGRTLLDGPHLLAAWLARAGRPQQVVVSEHGLAQGEIRALLARLDGVPVLALPDALFAQVSPVDTPSGVLAEVAIPPAPGGPVAGDCVVLDGLQDSGNLGSILRSAQAAGIGEALLTRGCAQAWSPRALRAGQGAQFALRIREQVDPAPLLAGYRGRKLAAAADGQSLYAQDLRGPVAWLFGAEGGGLTPQVAALADARVGIPMPGAAESLNVAAAAAVCLFEQVRQRHR